MAEVLRPLLSNAKCNPGQDVSAAADQTVMEYRHSCSFCGWGRESDTPVMLSPCCDRCGCALDALLTATDSRPTAQPFQLSARALLALRAAGVLSALLGFYAAAMIGYETAGPSGALVAFGVAGFLLLPFVPERI